MEKRLQTRVLFWAAVFFLFFIGSDRIPLWSSDEGRFGEIAREMWESKDFIVPHFNYVEHIEKPVFAFFLTALSIGAWGANSFGVRFPNALVAILGIFLTHFFTKRFFGQKTADLAALILTTSAGYMLMGRYGMIDILMTFLLSGALFSLAAACILRRGRLYLWAYLFMGLAFITKGLIGIVLPVLVFATYLLWTKEFREVKNMRMGWGLLILGLVFIPWGIAISIREPEFSYVFIMEQHFSRYATGFFGRSRPFWFFVPILVSFAFPWSVFLPAAALQGVREEKADRKKVVQFLVCWIGVVFIFFSIPKSKLPYYILPITVPMAVLTAVWFQGMLDGAGRGGRVKVFETLARWTGLFSISALLGLGAYFFMGSQDPRVQVLRGLLPPLTLFVFAGNLFAENFLRKKEHRRALLSIGVTLYASLLFFVAGMERLSPYLSTYEQAQTLKALWKEGDTVAVFASPDHFSDLPFHLKRRVMTAGSDRGTLTRELEEPEHAEEIKAWFLDAGRFIDLFNSGTSRVFCLLESDKIGELEQLGLSRYKIVQKDGGKLLISNSVL